MGSEMCIRDSGIVVTSFGAGSDRGQAVALQTDGKIVVAGYSHDGTKNDIILFRYNTDGSLDTTFGGGDGIVTTSLGTIDDRGVSIEIQADGHIVVGGFTIVSPADYDTALLRYDTNGDLDPGFGGGNGFVTTSIGPVSYTHLTLPTIYSV